MIFSEILEKKKAICQIYLLQNEGNSEYSSDVSIVYPNGEESTAKLRDIKVIDYNEE